MTVGVYTGEALARYGFGQGHPFGPDRLAAFERGMEAHGLTERVVWCSAVEAEETDILRFHTREYLERVKTQSVQGTGFLDLGDTPAFRGVYEAASHVVGSVVDAVAALMADELRFAFVPIAGLHHARRDRASGFCVFNDIGVVIEYLLEQEGLERVGYIDIDAHHGDGVYYGFADDPRVSIADIHQDGRTLFPGTGHAQETGTGAGAGTKLNHPLQPGADDEAFTEAWGEAEAHIRAHSPDFLILQAGVDSLAGDPLAGLNLSAASHSLAASRLAELAEGTAGGRLLVLGGGGYNRDNIGHGWSEVVATLLGADLE